MIYKFVNNFRQELTAGIDDVATTLVLNGGYSAIQDASASVAYMLTLFAVDENGVPTGDTEVVKVTATGLSDITVERGQEGTVAVPWTVGTKVEQRITAGYLNATLLETGDNCVRSRTAVGNQSKSIVVGDAAEVTGTNSVVIGDTAVGTDEDVAIGTQAHGGYQSVGVGAYANRDHPAAYWNVAVGADASAVNYSGAYGRMCKVAGASSVGVGDACTVAADYSAVVGEGAGVDSTSGESAVVGSRAGVLANSAGSTIVGEGSESAAPQSVILGQTGKTSAAASAGVAVGHLAHATVPGGFQLNAVPYLRGAVDLTGAVAPEVAFRTSEQVVIATDVLDLTSGTSAVSLDMPAGTMLFIDSIEVVVVGSAAPGGAPQVTVGADSGSPASYLAATPVGKTSVGGRESHTPLVTDGVTSLYAAVSTAGTGTTYEAKVVLRGYVMEI